MRRNQLVFFLAIFTISAVGQTRIKIMGGLSVIEHVSIGANFQLGNKHALTAMYGSNLFFGHHKFSNLLLQYDRSFPKLTRGKVTPRFGVRGGDSYFSDKYYRWHIMNIIPVFGANYLYSEKITFFAEAGVAIAFLQSVERIKEGEIGIYRQYLPEIKLGAFYTLYEKKKK